MVFCRFLQNNMLSFSHKLSCLEGFAAMIGIMAVPYMICNKEVLIIVDNSSFDYT